MGVAIEHKGFALFLAHQELRNGCFLGNAVNGLPLLLESPRRYGNEIIGRIGPYQTSKANGFQSFPHIHALQNALGPFQFRKLLGQFFLFQLHHGPACLVLVPCGVLGLGVQGFLKVRIVVL